MTEMQDEYFTIEQVASKLQVSERTVYRWIESGELCVIKLTPGAAGTVRIRESDLQEFLDEHRERRKSRIPPT